VSVGVGVCMHACMRAHVQNVSMHAWHGMPCASVWQVGVRRNTG
jgi:hypothetical protein